MKYRNNSLKLGGSSRLWTFTRKHLNQRIIRNGTREMPTTLLPKRLSRTEDTMRSKAVTIGETTISAGQFTDSEPTALTVKSLYGSTGKTYEEHFSTDDRGNGSHRTSDGYRNSLWHLVFGPTAPCRNPTRRRRDSDGGEHTRCAVGTASVSGP
jgi:hypothetical protein